MGILFYLLCVFINLAVVINIDSAVDGSKLAKTIIVLTGPLYTGVILGQVIVKYMDE